MNFSEKEWEIVIDGLARDFTAQFHGGDKFAPPNNSSHGNSRIQSATVKPIDHNRVQLAWVREDYFYCKTYWRIFFVAS